MRRDGEKSANSLEEREKSRLESPRFLSSTRCVVSVQVSVLELESEELYIASHLFQRVPEVLTWLHPSKFKN